MFSMDHLLFRLSEGFESLQHAAGPYIESSSRAAEKIFNSAITHSNSFYDQLLGHGGSFQSTLHHHWFWFERNIKDFWTQLCRTLDEKFSSLDLSYQYICYVIKREVNKSHVYVGCCCLVIGFAVGTYFRATSQKSVPRMRAVVCNSYGGAESVSLTDELPAPRSCGPRDILIEVKAASIDQLDIKITLGYGKVLRNQLLRYNKIYGSSLFPLIMGRECSGRVIEVGSSVDTGLVDVGDEVYAAVDFSQPGLASEVAVVPAENVAKKPRTLSHEAAAALPLSVSIAWHAIVEQSGLDQSSAKGKRVLVHAVQTSVGCVAVQLLKAWGAHVTGTVPKRAVPLAAQLGLDDLVILDAKFGRNADFDAEFNRREKFDVVLNTIGSSFHELSLQLCKEGGTVVTTVASPPPSDRYGFLMGSLFSLWIRLKFLFGRGLRLGDNHINSQVLSQVASLVDAGVIHPVVDRVFDAIDADRAALHVAKGDTLGKTIVRFRHRPLSRLEGFA